MCARMHMCTCVCARACVELRGQLEESAFSLHPLGPRDQTQVTRLVVGPFPCGPGRCDYHKYPTTILKMPESVLV